MDNISDASANNLAGQYSTLGITPVCLHRIEIPVVVVNFVN